MGDGRVLVEEIDRSREVLQYNQAGMVVNRVQVEETMTIS